MFTQNDNDDDDDDDNDDDDSTTTTTTTIQLISCQLQTFCFSSLILLLK